jgi:hypothetical protein
MANPFNIPERTIEQVATATNSINVVGGADGRLSVYQPLVVIVTDATSSLTPTWPDNTGTPLDEAELDRTSVVFVSKRHGEPWTRGSLTDIGLKHIIHNPTATIAGMAKDVTVIFPDFDYSTFE